MPVSSTVAIDGSRIQSESSSRPGASTVIATLIESSAAVSFSSTVTVVNSEDSRDPSGSQSPVAIAAGVAVGLLVVVAVAVTAVGVVLCLVVRKRGKATTDTGQERNGNCNYPNATYDGMFSKHSVILYLTICHSNVA